MRRWPKATPTEPSRTRPKWLKWFLDHAPAFLVPSLTPEPHPSERQYVRSFMIMRLGSGALALSLPLLLVGIGWWLDDESVPLGSLSEYYYSGAREVFVGVLCALAVFLLAYKVTEFSLEKLLSMLAAAFVVVVGRFRPGRPGGSPTSRRSRKSSANPSWRRSTSSLRRCSSGCLP